MFEEACQEKFGDDKFEIKVIDIIKNTKLAESDKIIATPTIIRKFPNPVRRAIGEITDKENASRAIEYLINDL
jgi:circadian clock protein KaiB